MRILLDYTKKTSYNYLCLEVFKMKVIKANLPDGVRKKFETRIGKKVKLVNKKYCKKKNTKNEK